MKKSIPEKTISRLLLYYRSLYLLLQQGTKSISSKSLADLLNIKDSLVRKDLSCFGRLGHKGSGYEVAELRHKIADILGLNKTIKACIVGAGSLGLALAAYKGFELLGFTIALLFDNSPGKIGHHLRGKMCYDIGNLAKIIKKEQIKIAILTLPSEAAQETSLQLEKAGVSAILNFTPVQISLSKTTNIRSIDLAIELTTLSFFSNNK